MLLPDPKRIKTCGACGEKSEGDTTECATYTYKGLECAVLDVRGHHCEKCGEVTMDGKEGDRYLSQTNIFRYVVDIFKGEDK